MAQKGSAGVQELEEGEGKVVMAVGVYEMLKEALGLGDTPDPVPVEAIAQRNYDRFAAWSVSE